MNMGKKSMEESFDTDKAGKEDVGTDAQRPISFSEWMENRTRLRLPRRYRKRDLYEYPVVPLRDMVVYPGTVVPLFIAREKAILAVEAAQRDDSPILAVAQVDPTEEDPDAGDIYDVGTEVFIERSLRMPDGTLSVLGQAGQRVIIRKTVHTEPYLAVLGYPLPPSYDLVPTQPGSVEESFLDAMRRAVLNMFDKMVQMSQEIPEEAYINALNASTEGNLADFVASVLSLSVEQHQKIMETIDPVDRLFMVSKYLGKEVEVLELENQIHSQVQQEMDKTQREYYLREQIRAIRHELGEGEDFQDLEGLREKLEASGMPDEVRKKAEKELARLASMPPAVPEVSIIRTYLDWLTDLPWNKKTEDNLDMSHAAKVLEENHYGLKKVKERLLEYIAVRKLAGDKMRSPILCFVGPPGTGKTSMGKSIATALGRKFVRVSLGGIRDEAEIRGHRRTYIGSMPGRIIQTMRNAGTINPLFMLDEIDKMGADFRGDPAAALLEVLDPEQNFAFMDHYLDVPYDLSKVIFITTANTLYTIPPALEDRMEVIEFPGYIEEEKVEIALRFLVPRQLREHGLKPKEVSFSRNAIQHIIREYTYEAGVRNLERNIATVIRKLARRLAEGKKIPGRVDADSLQKYLGPPQYNFGEIEDSNEIGVATGLAWTEAGGDTMPVEVLLMPGKGGLTMTGQLGDVMQESAQAALSYARAHSEEFGFGDLDFEKFDIHIHVPEGAIPKDGPSAGITMATALISALSQRPVRKDVAMTGEITLRGRVLPVGGVKAKVMAAHRAGIKTVILPARNKKDLAEVPKKSLRALKVVPVKNMKEVLEVALLPRESEGDADVD